MERSAKLSAMFSTILAAQWIAKERYGEALVTLLDEANTQTELNTLKYILEKLTYCNSEDLTLGSIEAAEQIVSGWALRPQDTLIVGVADGAKTCGSTAYLRAIQTQLPREWSQSPVIWTAFDCAFRKRDTHANLVIVDDFIGTGEKISKLIAKLLANPKTASYKIHVCCFAAMRSGASVVSSLVAGDVLVHRQFDRCISDTAADPTKTQMLKDMSALEANIFTKPGTYSLGYMQSEAAFYLEGFNIPNNNLPVLWWEEYADKTPRRPLFARR